MNTKRVWAFRSPDAREALSNCKVFVQALERDAGAPFDPFAACLVYSELVSNVVDHAPGPISIDVELQDQRLSVTVTDQGRGFTLRPSLPEDPFAEAGRGLFLVSQFSDELIAGSNGEGHYVRVTLAPAAVV